MPATEPSPAPTPTGGEQRRLERAPGERYAEPDPQRTGVAVDARGVRWIVAAVVVADLGAVVFFVLSQLDLGIGMAVVAGFIGWATALALVWKGREAAIRDARIRMAFAAFLGGWAVVGGCLLAWLFGLAEGGGSLGPIQYAIERFGIAAPAALVAGAFVASYRAR